MYVYVYKQAFTKSPTTVEHRIQTCSPIVIADTVSRDSREKNRAGPREPGQQPQSH